MLADAEARRFYRRYVALHGSLHWDAAVNNASDSALTLPRIFAATQAESPAPSVTVAADVQVKTRPARRTWPTVAVAATVLLAVAVGIFVARRGGDDPVEVVEQDRPSPAIDEPDLPQPKPPVPPLDLNLDRPVVENDPPENPDPPVAPDVPEDGSTDEAIVAFIDRQLEAGYAGAEVEPSPRADDNEWVRRIYLDVAGHIPPQGAVEEFLADERPNARRRLVQQLLDEPGYARHFATLWSNLLVAAVRRRTWTARPAVLPSRGVRPQPSMERGRDRDRRGRGAVDDNGPRTFSSHT